MNGRFFLDTNILVRRPNRSRRDQGSMQSPLQRRPPARTAIRQPAGREPLLVTAPGLAACPGFVGASQGCVVKTRAACLRMFVRGTKRRYAPVAICSPHVFPQMGSYECSRVFKTAWRS